MDAAADQLAGAGGAGTRAAGEGEIEALIACGIPDRQSGKAGGSDPGWPGRIQPSLYMGVKPE
jgi:hypothetical protein